MNRLQRIAANLGMDETPTTRSGVDMFLPFLERMRKDGATVMLKLDGQRTGP
jgi:hypothetical protein